MKKFSSLSLAIVFSISVIYSLAGMNAQSFPNYTPKNTLFAFDLDDVVSTKSYVSAEALFVGLKMVASHPTLLWNMREVIKKGKEIAKGNKEKNIQATNGTANIINKLMLWLEEEKKYKNMTEWTMPLVEACVNPIANKETLITIKELKKQGFTILFATNQDNIQFKIYCEKMKKQGYNLTTLFDGGVTTKTSDLTEEPSILEYNNTKTWYATEKAKPKKEYFTVLKNVASNLGPNKKIIFTDDKKKHTDKAQKLGIKGMHFTSAHQFKEDLKNFGINFTSR